MNSTVGELAQGAVVQTLQGAYAGMLRSVKEQPARPSGVWDQRNAAMAHGAAMTTFCQERIPVVCISLQQQHEEGRGGPMNMRICWCLVNKPQPVPRLREQLCDPLKGTISVDQKAYGARVTMQGIQ